MSTLATGLKENKGMICTICIYYYGVLSFYNQFNPLRSQKGYYDERWFQRFQKKNGSSILLFALFAQTLHEMNNIIQQKVDPTPGPLNLDPPRTILTICVPNVK